MINFIQKDGVLIADGDDRTEHVVIKFFALSLAATRRESENLVVDHIASTSNALTEADAIQEGLKIAEEKWSASEGWDVNVVAHPVGFRFEFGNHGKADRNTSKVTKPPLVITTEDEFTSLMDKIDSEMVEEEIKITARPFMAGLKITERYDIVLSATPPRRTPKPGCYDSVELSIRIFDWIDKRYGERVNIPSHIGKVVIPLRGALYCINCPTVFGKVNFVCEPNTFGITRENIGEKVSPTFNIVDSIQDFTKDFALSLTSEEVVKVSVAFVSAMGAFMPLRAIEDVKYVSEALGNFDAATSHLMEHKPQFGLSKWESLQAVEKLLKAYIDLNGGVIERTHSLQKLFDIANKFGLPFPPEGYLADLQCPAGVRYGEIVVSEKDAVIAQRISLELSEVIAQCIGKHLKRKMPIVPEGLFDGIPLNEFLKKHMK
jgi:hypothetical protein